MENTLGTTVSILLVAYGAVFVAELVGDKSIYTIGSLTLRFRLLPVFLGIAAAFSLKMLVAVLVGRALSELPAAPLAALSAATFFGAALVLWLRKPGGERGRPEPQGAPRSFALAFATVFLIEWGDIGQITAATLAARYQAPLAVWAGASLALVSKGLLAMFLGASLRQRAPVHVLRSVAVSLCIAMGLWSTFQCIQHSMSGADKVERSRTTRALRKATPA